MREMSRARSRLGQPVPEPGPVQIHELDVGPFTVAGVPQQDVLVAEVAVDHAGLVHGAHAARHGLQQGS